MAFDDIKKAIIEEAKKIAAEHKEAGLEKSAEISSVWEQKTADKIQEIISDASKKINQKIKQKQFKIQTESQLIVLEKKQEIIDQIFDAALKKLSSLPDARYIKLMEKLIADLPGEKALLFSVEGKVNLLKKALENSSKKFQISPEKIKGDGGFLLKSENIEINLTFEALIKEQKEKSLLEIANLVFNNK
jgi:V/A-type H+/Na+-transporting ATPase subunit E